MPCVRLVRAMPKRLSQEEVGRRLAWTRDCASCGKPFKWSKNGDKALCCSRICVGKLNGLKRKAAENSVKKHYECEICKKIFLSYYPNRKYCSRKCTGIMLSKTQKGRIGMCGKGKKDANHNEITNALRAVGASVSDLVKVGGGVPDIIAGYRGTWYVIEIKNPNTQYGKKGFSENQLKWKELQKCPVYLVYTIEDALSVIGITVSNDSG